MNVMWFGDSWDMPWTLLLFVSAALIHRSRTALLHLQFGLPTQAYWWVLYIYFCIYTSIYVILPYYLLLSYEDRKSRLDEIFYRTENMRSVYRLMPENLFLSIFVGIFKNAFPVMAVGHIRCSFTLMEM